MLYCDVCGKQNPEGNRVCDFCGAPLAANTSTPAPVSSTSGGPSSLPDLGAQGEASGPVCPKCKRTNRSGSVFCAYCGYSLKPGTAPKPYALPFEAPSATAVPNYSISPNVTGNLPTGTILKRRYRILRKIAQGGMGAVYEGVDTLANDGKRWAIKEISPAALPPGERSQAIADFRREAQLLATLSHPNLPTVEETFEEMGKHFLVMEFIPGRTLLNVLESTPGFLPEDRVMVWARQLFDVLNYLHSQDPPIIYRDLKPANVMLVEGTERIKLIDFGIARFHKAGKSHDTEAFGTAGYAPPEQYGKGQTDQRSDVYALAATLHHLLTKNDASLNPFNWLPVRRYNPAISVQVERALQTALSLDPDKRFQTMHDFATAMGIALPGATVARPRTAPAAQPAPRREAPAPTPAQHQAPSPAIPAVPAVPPTPAPRPSAPAASAASAGSRPAIGVGTQRPSTRGADGSRKSVPVPVSAAPAAPAPVVAPAAALPAPVVVPPAAASSAPSALPSNGPASVDISAPTRGDTGAALPVPVRPNGQIQPQAEEQPAKLDVPTPVVDLGEVRWNYRPARRLALRSATGGALRGSVISSQPWIAYYPPSFQGNIVTLDIKVKKHELPYGRTELHVPNLFAIIWAQTRGVLPFIGCWFWLLLMVASSVGRVMFWAVLGFVALVAVVQGLLWVWAGQARFFVPTEKLNTGRLLVKSSGGDRQIEVRVLARPSWLRKATGWTITMLLFAAEVAGLVWLVLAVTDLKLPLPSLW